MSIVEFFNDLKNNTYYSDCDYLTFSSLRDPLSFKVDGFCLGDKEFKLKNVEAAVEVKCTVTKWVAEKQKLFILDLEQRAVWTRFKPANENELNENLKSINLKYKGEASSEQIIQIVEDAFVKIQKSLLASRSLDKTDCILM